MKQLLISLILIFFSVSHYAQLGMKKFGPSVFQEMVKSIDGNYYVIGTTNELQARLIKMDQNQNILWEKTYTGPHGQNTIAYKIYENPDQSIFILGSVTTPRQRYSDLNSWIIKLDHTGQIIWNQTYSLGSSIFSICPNIEKGFFLGGIYGNTGTSRQGNIIKIDSNGRLLSSFNIFVGNRTSVKSLTLLKDSSLLIIGKAGGVNNFEGLFFIRRTINGTESYRVTQNTDYRESFNEVQTYQYPLSTLAKPNGNLLMVTPYKSNSDIHMLEFDPDSGKIISTKRYGDANIGEFPTGIIEFNGEYLISGYCESNYTGSKTIFPFAMKTTFEGKEIWKKYYNQIDSSVKYFDAVNFDNQRIGFVGFDSGPNGIIFQTFGDGYTHSNKIIGKVFFDANSNCKLDSSDLAIENVILKNLNDPNEFSATDSNGHYELYSESKNAIVVAYPNNEFLEICNNEKQVEIDTSTGIGKADFLIKSIDQCPQLVVQILQPDLLKCKNSQYLVIVKNYGGEKSEADELLIQFDNSFTLVESTVGGIISGRTLSYAIPPLNPFEEKQFNVTLLLNCDVVLGASHLVTATILGSECGLNWTGPDLEIVSTCNGNAVESTITNHGADMNKPAFYKTYLGQYLIEDSELLLESGESKKITYLTNGQSFFIELEDPEGVLKPGKYISDYMEACGTDNIGLYNLSNSTAFSKFNPNKQFSSSLAINTSKAIDKIHEVQTGLGLYHFITSNDWMEYTVKVKNQLNTEVHTVEFNLLCSKNFDASNFQILANNGRASILALDSTNIRILVSGINLASKDADKDNYLILKFRLKPFHSTPFDSGDHSLLIVRGAVYFNNSGPFDLIPGFNNLTKQIPNKANVDEIYPNDMTVLGGRYYTFGTGVCEASDGSIYLLMASSSFNGRGSGDPYLVKLDKGGKFVWSSSITLDMAYSMQNSIVASNDGGCIISGVYWPKGATGNVYELSVGIIKVDKFGKTEFIKSYKPGPDNFGGYSTKIVRTMDGNYLITGFCQAGENLYDNFVTKVDIDGNIIWHKNYIEDTLSFSSFEIHELDKGDILITGIDEIRLLVCALKINSNGEKIWLKTHAPNLTMYPSKTKTVLNKSGEIVFLLESVWPDSITKKYYVTPQLLKYSSDLTFVGEKTPIIGISGNCISNTMVVDESDNIFVIGAVQNDSTDRNMRGLIAKFDKNFDTIWTKAYGVGKYEIFYDGLISSDGKIHAIGNNQRRFPDYNLQAVYIVTDTFGNLVNSETKISFHKETMLIYPNPANEFLYLLPPDNYSIDKLEWFLFDLNGREILNGKCSNANKISVQGILNGVYIMKFNDPNLKNCKIIVHH